MKTRMLVATASFAAVLLLSACSKPPAAKVAVTPAAASTANALMRTPLAPLLKDEEKARGVQKTVLDAAAKQRQAIKDAGG